MTQQQRVLSIQSHVVHGYVGNRAATFPLQFLGFDVDALNSVQYSNHTQYPGIKGTVFDDKHFLDILEGLRSNDLLNYQYILSGYMGSKSSLDALRKIVQEVKEFSLAHGQQAVYLLDPVLGDNGRMYVPNEIVPVYRDMLALADIITPNDFEVELLTGVKVIDSETAKEAIAKLKSMGAKNVVITSYFDSKDSRLVLVGSDDQSETFEIRFSRLSSQFTGTGDLFAALLLAHFKEHGLKRACEKTVSVMQKVLMHTEAKTKSMMETKKGNITKAFQMDAIELDLIGSRHDFICHEPQFKAKLLN